MSMEEFEFSLNLHAQIASLQNIKERNNTNSTHSMKPTLMTLTLRPYKDTIRKENYRPASHMNRCIHP